MTNHRKLSYSSNDYSYKEIEKVRLENFHKNIVVFIILKHTLTTWLLLS